MKFVRYPELKRDYGIPYTRVHLYRLEAKKQFPARAKLSENVVAWRSDELEKWVAARSAERTRDAA